MYKKLISLILVAILLMVLTVTAFANKGGCPNSGATSPGRGADPPAPHGGHGPGWDHSAHGSGDGQKNFLRCNPPPE